MNVLAESGFLRLVQAIWKGKQSDRETVERLADELEAEQKAAAEAERSRKVPANSKG